MTLASEDKDTPVREKKKENSSTCLKDQTWKKFANIIKLDIASLKNIVKRHMKTVCENTPDCKKKKTALNYIQKCVSTLEPMESVDILQSVPANMWNK